MSRRTRRQRTRTFIKDIASERIEQLFELAEAEFSNHSERSDRYVQLAKEIGMRYRVRLPKRFKVRFCRKCVRYLVYGVNARVRVNKKRTVITCLNCGDVRRY
jgi:ribonuclease P protein subunit RPR2